MSEREFVCVFGRKRARSEEREIRGERDRQKERLRLNGFLNNTMGLTDKAYNFFREEHRLVLRFCQSHVFYCFPTRYLSLSFSLLYLLLSGSSATAAAVPESFASYDSVTRKGEK